MNFRQNGDKYLITIEVIALIVVLVFGAVHFVMPGNNANKKITESRQETQNPTQETDGTKQVQVDGQQTAPAFTPSDSVKTKLSSMTTEEKVAQLFITRPEEITGVSEFTQAGNKTKAAIGTYPLGGFVFRQENFSGEAAVTKMMSSLQSFSQERLGVNLFLAIDEEGGERLPLASANGYEAQQAPSQLGDADAAGSSAGKIGSYMATNGLNMNFGPTADIAYGDNADNDTYAFGSESATVGDCVAAQVSSYNGAGINSVAKSFPGKGKATTDSATGMLWMTDKLEDLEASDFVPYQKAIEAGVPAVMMGNVICQSVTGEETTPCSTSAGAVNYMRTTMGFNGLLITDDLSDASLNKVCTQIADIDYAKIQLYAGNYDFWYESSQLIIKQMKEANKKKEEKIKELQDFIQRFSANASKSKQATSRKRALEKIELDEIRPSSRKYPYIDFRPAREIGNEVLQVEGISKTIDGVKVLDNISFIVNKDDKIAFVGSNELATTTLFNILTGNMEPDEGSYKWGVTTSQAYFPKDSAAEFNREDTIVEWLTQYSPDPDPTYVRGFLGRMLFAGDDGVKKVKVLSGGEKVRCLISKMMIMGSNVLIFDDPTNHLDMESITALNNGLIKFPGVALFTSHDHQFIQTTANRIMEIVPSGQLIDKITTYDEYLESDEMARKRQGFAEAASDDED